MLTFPVNSATSVLLVETTKLKQVIILSKKMTFAERETDAQKGPCLTLQTIFRMKSCGNKPFLQFSLGVCKGLIEQTLLIAVCEEFGMWRPSWAILGPRQFLQSGHG